MRLLIIGTLDGQIGAASKIAIDRGAKVQQANTVDAGLKLLRAGHGADLIMIDVSLDVSELIQSLELERITLTVVGCGVGNDTQAAVRAIRAGGQGVRAVAAEHGPHRSRTRGRRRGKSRHYSQRSTHGRSLAPRRSGRAERC